MATQWEGKSRGNVLGYRIFVFLIQNLGVRAAYFLLYFVVFYFCFASAKSTRAIFYYFRHRLGYSWMKSVLSIYSSYYALGQSIIDKITISTGQRDTFTYTFDGIENIREVLDGNKGGILISAHVGNFEIAEYFLSELDHKAVINLLVTDAERQEIKEYLGKYLNKTKARFIVTTDDLGHIFEVNAALARNEIVCVTGDRYRHPTKCLEHELLGKSAKFPAGPFLLGSRLNVPVLLVYVMKERATHYHLYARHAQNKSRKETDLLSEYVASVTAMVNKYPTQWFNYYDFWEELG